MAEKMNPRNYENMINALRAFAAKTTETSGELSVVCRSAAQEFGEDDLVSIAAAKSAQEIANRYYELATEARNIAQSMEEELEKYYKEREVLNSDDAADDY